MTVPKTDYNYVEKHTHIHTKTHTHVRVRMHTHAHTQTHARMHALTPIIDIFAGVRQLLESLISCKPTMAYAIFFPTLIGVLIVSNKPSEL